MKLKPFTPENGKIGFLASKRFIEVVLFLMLAIQLFQEFYEIEYLTYITIALSYSGAGVFLVGILCKYVASISEKNIYHDMLEITDFYSVFLGSILIPVIFLFDVDDVVFESVSIKHIDVVKQILLFMGFASAVFNRYILRRSQKFSQKLSFDEAYEETEDGKFNFELIIGLNGLNMNLNFVLLLLFCYIAFSFKWKNTLFGESASIFAYMLIVCMMLYATIDDQKHTRLKIAIAITVITTLFNLYRIFF